MQAASDELFELRTHLQSALLKMLEKPHHARGLLIEDVRRFRVEPSVGAVEAVEVVPHRRLRLAQETENSTHFLRLDRVEAHALGE